MRRRAFVTGSAVGTALLAGCTGTSQTESPTAFRDLRHQLGVLETVGDLDREGGVTVGVVPHRPL